jgi:hypothetical protein
MKDKIIEIEAETLEEARKRIKSQIPEGLHLLSEKIISDGKPKTVRAIGDTSDSAFIKAQIEIPDKADIIEKKVVSESEHLFIIVKEETEKIAYAWATFNAKDRFGSNAEVKNLKLTIKGKKGFLGFGKQNDEYNAEIFRPAEVVITYKTKTKICATIGEKKVEVIKLAVMAYEERSGLLKLMGEDANGRSFNLIEVSQPALLFVPRETLPHFKRNQKLWSRVINPDATANKKSSLREDSEAGGGLLAALLVGPMMDSIEASSLLPCEFRINVVDTYADAKMKIEGLGLFG